MRPVPNNPKWSLHPIKFHRYYDLLDQARQRAANYSSSDESNTINQIKESHTKQLPEAVFDDESESDYDVSHSKIPNPPNLSDQNVQSTNTISNIFDLSVINDINMEGTIVSHKSVQDVHTLVSEMLHKMEDHFKQVYTVITTVSLELQELNIRLTNIEKENNQRKPEASDKDVLNMQQLFPFQDINKVTAFENQLSQNVDEYNKFVLYLSRIGGRSAKENLIRIYRTLFSNEVAKDSSWKGLRNHFKISTLKTILMGIQATISDQYQITNKEFEEITKEWFRQGGQRLSRQQKNSLSNND